MHDLYNFSRGSRHSLTVVLTMWPQVVLGTLNSQRWLVAPAMCEKMTIAEPFPAPLI